MVGPLSAHDPFLVCLDVGQIINFKAHAELGQFIHRLIDIFHRKIYNSECCWNMVWLGIDQNVIVAGEVQRQQSMRFRNLQPKCFAVELFRLSMSLAENH